MLGSLAVIVSSLWAEPPQNIDFTALKPCQQVVFKSFPPGPRRWNSLDDSQRLEFAGGTQSLITVATTSSACRGLEEVIESSGIFGSIPAAASAAQFHIDVKWAPGADEVFGAIRGWGPHLAWLHPGQKGYQQNQNGNPFLGIVVLFDVNDRTMGQFHIGFRSLFWHYLANNGNIAKNYQKYCHWYGVINGYGPECDAPPLQFDWLNGQLSPEKPFSNDLRQTVRDFLQTWYVERNLDSLSRFLADDNAAQFFISGGVFPKGTLSSYWSALFFAAFPEWPGVAKVESLRDAITYPEPAHLRSQPQLSYLNDPAEDHFAIIEPDSSADALFPQRDIPSSQLDAPSQFLRHLREKYFSGNPNRNTLNLVVYITNQKGLVPETSVLYWIKEQGGWKLAAFEGTD
jgi:hypothetical protein